MTPPAEAARLLDQLAVVQQPCDLDLLVFFARHPRTLLSSDQIAGFLGYEVKAVAASLELLLDSGFVTRTSTRRQVARLYALADGPPGSGWLLALTRLATTRVGRLALLDELQRRSETGSGDAAQAGHTPAGAIPAPLRFPQGRTPNDDALCQGMAGATRDSDDSADTSTRGGTR